MKGFVVAVVVAMAAAGGAAAEVVVRDVPNGLLALGRGGTPYVAFVQRGRLVVAHRVGRERWRRQPAGRITKRSSVAAFAVEAAEPAVVVVGPGQRTLFVVRRRRRRWVRIPLVRHLDPGVVLGWPGLALDARGLP